MARQPVERVIQEYVELLNQRNIRVAQAILFGSHALGTADEDSDIDVAIISPDLGSVWQVESAQFGGQNVHRLTAAPGVGSSYPSGLGRRVEGLPLRAHPVRFSRCV